MHIGNNIPSNQVASLSQTSITEDLAEPKHPTSDSKLTCSKSIGERLAGRAMRAVSLFSSATSAPIDLVVTKLPKLIMNKFSKQERVHSDKIRLGLDHTKNLVVNSNSGKEKTETISSNKLKTLATMAQVSNFSYDRDLQKLNDNALKSKGEGTFGLNLTSEDIKYELLNTISVSNRPDAAKQPEKPDQKPIGKDTIHLDNNTIVCKNSGLVFSILSEGDDKIHLIFGGTTSGKKTESNPILRGIKNMGITKKQWLKSNIKMARGGMPLSYLQAASVAAEVFKLTGERKKTLVISGHSKGGGEASFSLLSLAKNTPQTTKLPQAYCFSSAELNEPLLNTLGTTDEEVQTVISRAKGNITHTRVAGDKVSTASRVFKTLNLVGDVITMPGITKKDGNPIISKVLSFFGKPQTEKASEQAGILSSHTDYQTHIKNFVEHVV